MAGGVRVALEELCELLERVVDRLAFDDDRGGVFTVGLGELLRVERAAGLLDCELLRLERTAGLLDCELLRLERHGRFAGL